MGATDPLGLIGQVIDGKYEVEAVAGSGGTAVVYRAMHLAWQRRVALKVVRVLGEMSEQHRDILFAQLTLEAGVLASLSERTSAIVQARDIGYVMTAGNHLAPYLVLEWVDGTALDVVLETERAQGAAPRGILEAVRLLEPIAQGLALAHHRGIAHRDVKPGNIFVLGEPRSPESTTKILDFGIAKVVAEAHAREGGFRRTAGTFTAFTPAYGAPEQFSRDFGSTGPWTDVFGLALVLAEVATGREAFLGEDVMELAAQVSAENGRPTLGGPGIFVPDQVAELFARAVAVDPAKRPSNAGDFWRELHAALGLGEPLSLVPASVSIARFSSARMPAAVSIVSTPDSPPTEDPPLDETLDRGHLTTTRPSRARLLRRTLFPVVLAATAGALVTAAIFRPDSASSRRPVAAAVHVDAAPASASAPTSAPIARTACPAGMVLVPGGRFFMGSDEPIALDFERPAHKVKLDAYCIDRTEVTVSAYKQCSDRGACRPAPAANAWIDIEPSDRKIYDPLCNIRDPEGRGDHPINCVDWRMADEYCHAQSLRLPTEAEWELAARGHDGRTYPWGDDAPSASLLNACGSECAAWGRVHKAEVFAMFKQDDGFATTAPVGSFPKGASPYGVQDVVGNVWEWVADRYAPYGAGELVDPRGPENGTERVIRGGAWNGSEPAWVRPTFRYKDEPEKKSHGIGFRCAAVARP
jgi:eukaryotic-like serine/threonine-protein kinase